MQERIQQIKSLLKEKRLDGIVISSIPSIIYLTNYAGFSKEEREAYLLITATKQYIITDRRYSEAVKKDVSSFTLFVRDFAHPIRTIIKDLVAKQHIKRLGFEEHNLSIAEFLSLKKELKDNKTTFVPSQNVLAKLREIKTGEQIKAIENACTLGDKAFAHALKKIKPGMTEKELAWEIELFIKQHGGDLSFRTIVAFGQNAAIPHHMTSNQPLVSSHQFVLIDMGVSLNNYCSDMTRTVFFGKATSEQKKMYQTVLEAQTKAIEFLHKQPARHQLSPQANAGGSVISNQKTKGISAIAVDRAARDHITANGYPSIPHSLGHGTGLEVHENPSLGPTSKDILKPGMVFSIEPGVYIPGFGGVRIEDLVVLENSGPKLLTKAPRHLLEIQ